MERLKKIPLPGYRNIKTGICVFLCLICYNFIAREGVMLAVVASIICMQDSVEKSISSGIDRVRGTVLGGLFATVVVLLGVTNANAVVYMICCCLGLVLFIYLCNLMDIRESIVIGCLVFMMIMVDAENSAMPLSYCFNRTLDTLIGIIIAIIVNRFVFRPKPERIRSEHIAETLGYEIHRYNNLKNMKWAGGVSKELYIFPEDAIYGERNFIFRISTATVEIDHSEFTKLPDYKRYIMLLDGAMHLFHQGQHDINLSPFDTDCFLGQWTTKCQGQGTDLNLMVSKGYTGSIHPVNTKTEVVIEPLAYSGFYIIADGVSMNLFGEGVQKRETLKKGDYISIPAGAEKKKGYKAVFEASDEDLVAAVLITCQEETES